MDEALDLLSDSLGEREPDPDENKPVVDKVKVTKDILKLMQSGGKKTQKQTTTNQIWDTYFLENFFFNGILQHFYTCRSIWRDFFRCRRKVTRKKTHTLVLSYV